MRDQIWKTRKLKDKRTLALGCSFLLVSISAATTNIYILTNFGWSALGAFNQAYVVFLLVAQVFGFGQTHTIYRYFGQPSEARNTIPLQTPILISFGACLACFFTLAAIAEPIGDFLGSQHPTKFLDGLKWALLLLPLNKVLLAFMTISNRIFHVSVVHSIRAISIVVFGILACLILRTAEAITLGFLIAELIIFFVCASSVKAVIKFEQINFALNSMTDALRYGVKTLPYHIFTELNFRIDLIMIGILESDTAVGVYSLASNAIEGYLSFVFFLKSGIVARSKKFMLRRRFFYLTTLSISTIRLNFSIICLFPAASMLAVYVLTVHFASVDQALLSVTCVGILSFGFSFFYRFMLFDQLLVLLGQPVRQSIFQSSIFFCNVLLNLALIPLFGLTGAAFATLIAFSLGFFYLVVSVNKTHGINLMRCKV